MNHWLPIRMRFDVLVVNTVIETKHWFNGHIYGGRNKRLTEWQTDSRGRGWRWGMRNETGARDDTNSRKVTFQLTSAIVFKTDAPLRANAETCIFLVSATALASLAARLLPRVQMRL